MPLEELYYWINESVKYSNARNRELSEAMNGNQ